MTGVLLCYDNILGYPRTQMCCYVEVILLYVHLVYLEQLEKKSTRHAKRYVSEERARDDILHSNYARINMSWEHHNK